MLFVSLSDPALMKTFALHRHFTNGSLATWARQAGRTIHQLEHTPLSIWRRRHYEARGHWSPLPIKVINNVWSSLPWPPRGHIWPSDQTHNARRTLSSLNIGANIWDHDQTRPHTWAGAIPDTSPVITGIILTAACYRSQTAAAWRAGVSALRGQKMGRRLRVGSSHQQSYMCQPG